jgi:DNA gyrase subunit B
MSDKLYAASNIQVLSTVEAIRRHPGMYFGESQTGWLTHFLLGIFEGRNGVAWSEPVGEVGIKGHRDGLFSYHDDSLGLPVEIGLTGEMPFLQMYIGGRSHYFWFTILLAFSDLVVIEVARNGRHYRQCFDRGTPVAPLEDLGLVSWSGNHLTFHPSAEFFGGTRPDWAALARRQRDLAGLLPGVRFTWTDEVTGKGATCQFPQGLMDLLEAESLNVETLSPWITARLESRGVTVTLAVQFRAMEGTCLHSFVNLERTEDGEHVTGLWRGLTRACNTHAITEGWLERRIEGNGYGHGLLAGVAVRMERPHFRNACRTSLLSSEVQAAVSRVTCRVLRQFLNQNPVVAERIIRRAAERTGGINSEGR